MVTILNLRPDRIVGEVRNGNGLYVSNRHQFDGLNEALTTAKRQKGRHAREVHELLSRTYGIAPLTRRVVSTSDLVKMIGEGRLMRTVSADQDNRVTCAQCLKGMRPGPCQAVRWPGLKRKGGKE
ncbi:MAG TPA: hypothetical protein PKL28_04385 [Rhodocyclaceae bacterium]|nr:hypothetical protein [Rhodocyclaceae bacterium]HMZ55450.1 hypothetical protein [Nitrospira sp.]HNM80266.1 hypothetical protein [Rhodocyclaceae bacterium]